MSNQEQTPQPFAEQQEPQLSIPPELKVILDKIEKGEPLTPDEENKVLALDLLNTKQELEQTKRVLADMVKHLCAVVGIFHHGLLKIDKTQFENFFTQFDARAAVGVEHVTGNRVIQVQVKPKKNKKILSASTADMQQVEKTRIIQP